MSNHTLLDAAVCFVLRHVFLISASVVLTQPGCNTPTCRHYTLSIQLVVSSLTVKKVCVYTGGSRTFVWGQVKRQRQAPRGWDLGRGCPLPMGRGLGRRLCPSPEIFRIFCLGMVHFACILTRLDRSQPQRPY